jgi:hypothetical protein
MFATIKHKLVLYLLAASVLLLLVSTAVPVFAGPTCGSSGGGC